MKSVVVLVHGTWASGSRWEKLERRLRDCVPKPLTISYFCWTGRNSVRKRAQAVEHLSAYLRGKISEFPDAKLYVIAHSHGGNIAVQAITSDLESRLVRIICLSTPFLVSEPRSRAVRGQALRSAFAVALSLIVTVQGLVMDPLFTLLESASLVGISGFVLLLVGWLLLIAWLIDRSGKRWDTAAKSVARALGATPSRTLPLFILRSPADEASLALVTVQSLTQLTERLLRRSAAVYEWMRVLTLVAWRRWFRDVLPQTRQGVMLWVNLYTLIVPFPLTLAIVFFEPHPAWLWVLIGILGMPIWIALAAGLVVIGIALVTVPLSFGMMASMVAYGGIGMISGAIIRSVSVEPAPPGEWAIAQLPPRKRSFRGLRHSASYQERDAVDQICRWVSFGGQANRL